MPEGHSVHRIARQFSTNFVGKQITATSPQGRFASGAAELSGRVMTDAQAVGKQMFLGFEPDLWLRVHLGIYGAWDFAGEIVMDPTILSAAGRMGQTNSSGSIGAPRKTRLRISESEKAGAEYDSFPPEPIGQVRVRLLTDATVADLRGPTACEVLLPEQVQLVLDRLGPDPMGFDGASPEAEQRVVQRILRSSTPIGLLLMDQSVVAGIGNVYRAEMLFRARIDPYKPGNKLTPDQATALWQDWRVLLAEGIRTGQMITMDGLSPAAFKLAMANREDRHWVYKREGLPCRICDTNIALSEMANRKLYFCPSCQV